MERTQWRKARKRPIEIEFRGPYTTIETIEGDFEVDEEYIDEHGGYYVIRGIEDEVYPCGADIFENTYEVTSDTRTRNSMTDDSSQNQILHSRVRNRRDEAERALPPLLQLDGEIYWETLEIIQSNVPEYFWDAPAASSYKHHNPYCCGEQGLWIHTLMVATAYERLVDSYVEQGLITPYEGDLGRAAVLLHDLKKYGDQYEPGDRAAKDHDLQAAAIVRDSEFDDRVADAIAAHMGSWYEGPAPETPLQQLVHMADMVASTKNGTFGVYGKPLEISNLYPSLPEAEL